MTRFLPLLICLFVAGCGDTEQPQSAPPPTPVENGEDGDRPERETSTPTASPKVEDVPEASADAKPEPEEDSEVPPSPETAEDSAATDDASANFEEQFARVVELEADAEFHEAMKLCRELRKQYRTGDEAEKLGRKMAQLAEYARRSGNLPYALRKLGSDSGQLERRVARRKLAEAGELGNLYLRKAIRERMGNGIAEEAAEILIYEEGADSVPFLVEQLDPVPEPSLLGTLVKGIVRNIDGLPVPSLLALIEFTHTPAADPWKKEFERVLRQGANVELSPGALAPFFVRVVEDEDFERRRTVELLALLYDAGTGRDDEAFERLLGGDGRLQILREYAGRAADAEDEELAAWGVDMTNALSRINYGALQRGLVAWWAFDAVNDGLLSDAGGKGRTAEFVNGEPELVEGRVGNSLRFDTEKDGFVESGKTPEEIFHKLHRNSYGFAAWINPDGLPDGEQPDPWWAIVLKPGYHQGLALNPQGQINFTQYYEDQEGISAGSELSLPQGTWTRVVGSVNQDEHTIRIFVNGTLAGEQHFPEGKGWWDRHDGEPVRVGAARTDRRDWACRFNGRIDEVAVYNRALTEVDAGHLYRIRTPEQRAAIQKE